MITYEQWNTNVENTIKENDGELPHLIRVCNWRTVTVDFGPLGVFVLE